MPQSKYKFSARSLQRLETCHPVLQKLFKDIIGHSDCTVLSGARTEEEQRELVKAGKSKTMNSKHLVHRDGWSHAVDVAPYPIDWEDTKRFYLFAGRVLERAKCLGLDIRWGGDWDSDGDLNDQSFNDLVHFEIRYYD